MVENNWNLCVFWRYNQGGLLLDWMWGMQEVSRGTPRCLIWVTEMMEISNYWWRCEEEQVWEGKSRLVWGVLSSRSSTDIKWQSHPGSTVWSSVDRLGLKMCFGEPSSHRLFYDHEAGWSHFRRSSASFIWLKYISPLLSLPFPGLVYDFLRK